MRPFAPFPWKQAFAVAVGVLLTSATPVSAAQPSAGFDLAWPGLSADDLDRMHAAAERLNEGRSIGTVERWRSPDSSDAGEVKLIRSFTTHGMPCRTLDYFIRFETQRDRLDHYVINWCKIPTGEWKIVELPPPR
jgi:hypothetical protein